MQAASNSFAALSFLRLLILKQYQIILTQYHNVPMYLVYFIDTPIAKKYEVYILKMPRSHLLYFSIMRKDVNYGTWNEDHKQLLYNYLDNICHTILEN